MSIGSKLRRIFDPATAKAVDQAKAFTAAVNSSTLPNVVRGALLDRGHLGQTPEQAIEYAGTVRDLCAAALARSGKVDASTQRCADLVRINTPVDVVRRELISAAAEADEAVTITTHHPDPAARRGSGSPIEPASVYRSRSTPST